MMLSGQGGGGRCLFTASQWQELEHQALIYKYMAAGTPVPPDLVLPLRHRDGFAIDTAPSLALPPHQPSLGWRCFGAAAQYGRKAEDPEPGRCRRTDGKKWRCSREAYGDSKYCEKHMHRGKNRSRKPVETMSSSPAGASYRPSALSISPPAPDAPSYGHHHHLDRPDASSARARAPAQVSPLQLHLDVAAHATSPPPSYHRYAQYGTSPLFPSGYGYGPSREHEEAEARRRRHFLAFGADLSLDKPAAAGHDAAAATEKPLRRFFDEWPRESSGGRPWMGMDQDETQLSISISIPTASPDLAVAAASRYHNADE